MSTDCDMTDIDTLTIAMGNAEVDSQGPTSQVNRLAEQLATSNLSDFASNPTQGTEVVFPPYATDDEKLLILAGAEDWKLTPIHTNGFTDEYEYLYVELPTPPPEFGPLSTTPLLPEGELAVKAYWAGVRKTVEIKYAWILECELNDLQDAAEALPDDPHERAELCEWVADMVYERWVKGGKMPVFAPRECVWYPCWVGGEHPSNEIIMRVKEEVDRMEEQAVSGIKKA